jgi:hypothetical protein
MSWRKAMIESGKRLTDLLCDPCMAKVERMMSLMEFPDGFYATAAVMGEGEMCAKCEAKINASFEAEGALDPSRDED